MPGRATDDLRPLPCDGLEQHFEIESNGSTLVPCFVHEGCHTRFAFVRQSETLRDKNAYANIKHVSKTDDDNQSTITPRRMSNIDFILIVNGEMHPFPRQPTLR